MIQTLSTRKADVTLLPVGHPPAQSCRTSCERFNATKDDLWPKHKDLETHHATLWTVNCSDRRGLPVVQLQVPLSLTPCIRGIGDQMTGWVSTNMIATQSGDACIQQHTMEQRPRAKLCNYRNPMSLHGPLSEQVVQQSGTPSKRSIDVAILPSTALP